MGVMFTNLAKDFWEPPWRFFPTVMFQQWGPLCSPPKGEFPVLRTRICPGTRSVSWHVGARQGALHVPPMVGSKTTKPGFFHVFPLKKHQKHRCLWSQFCLQLGQSPKYMKILPLSPLSPWSGAGLCPSFRPTCCKLGIQNQDKSFSSWLATPTLSP